MQSKYLAEIILAIVSVAVICGASSIVISTFSQIPQSYMQDIETYKSSRTFNAKLYTYKYFESNGTLIIYVENTGSGHLTLKDVCINGSSYMPYAEVFSEMLPPGCVQRIKVTHESLVNANTFTVVVTYDHGVMVIVKFDE
ncbi:hypothetical protein DRO02_03905 [archaeon]|nr:MAG: hypothetical protein DRO02_03905 [archaeon]RLG65151.1 MAG: hypothetical protein DRO21_02505 [archaeon]